MYACLQLLYMQKDIHANPEALHNQKRVLKYQMDKAITDGKTFEEVKRIHLRIKALNNIIDQLEKESATSIRIPSNTTMSTQARV